MSSAKKRKVAAAADAKVVHRFDDGSTLAQPLVETVLAHIRQWVALEEAEHPEDRDAAKAKLRRAAELIVRGEAELLFAQRAGKEGAARRLEKRRGPSSKRAEILRLDAAYHGKETDRASWIARQADVSSQYVRRVLKARNSNP